MGKAAKSMNTFPGAEEKYVSYAPYIKIGEVLIQVEVNPSVYSQLFVQQDMIIAYVSMKITVCVDKLDGLKGLSTGALLRATSHKAMPY